MTQLLTTTPSSSQAFNRTPFLHVPEPTTKAQEETRKTRALDLAAQEQDWLPPTRIFSQTWGTCLTQLEHGNNLSCFHSRAMIHRQTSPLPWLEATNQKIELPHT
jgi:hypothetical protein